MPNLTHRGICILIALINRDAMIENNLGIVYDIARQYQSRGLSMDDMVQEGTIGLMKGLQRFDPGRNCKVSTYASWWIRAYILRAIADNTDVRIPKHLYEARGKVFKLLSRRATMFGGDADIDDVLDTLDVPEKRRKRIRNLIKIGPVTEWSLDIEIEGKKIKRDTYKDALPDDASPVDNEVISKLQHDDMLEKMELLNDRERFVLENRFWMDRTLEDIGLELGITRERVRQIEKAAISFLREIIMKERGNEAV